MNSKEEILTWLEEVSPERKRYLKEFNNSLENSKDSSKWSKALTNLKNNGITGKVVGDKIILKKNGKTYEIDKMFRNFPEDLAGNKLDIITVFFNRNKGGVGPKHSEDFTTKTNLKLLGKTLKEDALDEEIRYSPEDNRKREERAEKNFNYKGKQAFLNKAKSTLIEKLNNIVKPYIEKYLRDGEIVKFVIFPNDGYNAWELAEGSFLFPVSVIVKLLDGRKVKLDVSRSGKGLYDFKNVDDSIFTDNKGWNSLFNHRLHENLNYFNKMIANKISKAYREYVKEIIHSKEGRDFRTNYKGKIQSHERPKILAEPTKTEKLAYEEYISEDVNYFPY